LRDNPVTHASWQTFKNAYPDTPESDQFEDIFPIEEHDERLLAAWEARALAEINWQELLKGRGRGARNASC
jgi:hypothetical protein